MGSKMDKREIVKEIIKDLETLDSVKFEDLAHAFIQQKEGIRLDHRGINRDGRPVGYTVDSLSDVFSVVGEYSVEKDYFSKTGDKIPNDIQHIKKVSNNVKRAYLISNQIAENTEINHWQNTFCAETFEIVLMDGKRLAEEIFDLLNDKPNIIVHFHEYLPNMNELMMMFGANMLPEQDDGYVRDDRVFNDFCSNLDKQQITIVYGLSGSGKSQLTIDYATFVSNQYDCIYWINSKDVNNADSLSNVYIKRFGKSINLESVIQNTKTLLIIDGFDAEFSDELVDGVIHKLTSDSKIIITSINMPHTVHALLPMPQYGEDILEKILLNGLNGTDVDKEKVGQIINKIKSHPFSLKLINGCVRCGDFSFENICPELSQIEIGNSQTIVEKIFRYLNITIKASLSVIAFFKQKSFDQLFLEDLVGLAQVNNLKRRSLISLDVKSKSYNIHDIAYHLLPTAVDTCNEEDVLNKSIDLAIKYDSNCMYNFFKVAYILVPIIMKKYGAKDIKPGRESFILLKTELKNDYIKTVIEILVSYDIKEVVDFIEIRSIIEAYERNFLILSEENKTRIRDEFQVKLQQMLATTDNNEVKALLNHHLGKNYRALKRNEESIKCLEEANKLKESSSTTLQLARSYMTLYKEKKEDVWLEKAKGKMVDLEKMILENNDISTTISLSFIEDLKQYKELSETFYSYVDNVKLVASQIIQSAANGYTQSWNAFIPFSRAVYYHHASILLEVTPYLIIPSFVGNTTKELINISECYKQSVKASKEIGSESEKYKKLSIIYLKKINFEDMLHLNSFDKTTISETMCMFGTDEDTNKAIELLNSLLPEEENAFTFQKKARCQFKCKKYSEALDSANEAVERSKKTKYYSTMLELKANVLHALSRESEALKALCDAIHNCLDDKYKKRLEDKYFKWKCSINKFNQ